MDTLPPSTPLPPDQPTQPDSAELEQRVDSLQRLVGTVLVLLLIVSGTFSIFLYWQVRTANRELEAGRQQVDKIQAQQDEIIKRMTDFGRTHTDFAPILAKYGIKLDGTIGGLPAAPASPALSPKK